MTKLDQQLPVGVIEHPTRRGHFEVSRQAPRQQLPQLVAHQGQILLAPANQRSPIRRLGNAVAPRADRNHRDLRSTNSHTPDLDWAG